MVTCPSCGEENPGHARFCLACGNPLEAAAPAGEERKVVSVLFVDLVGFTRGADGADPEDVRATLRPYHERVKADIERFGGTVEKFIGDAVMAVFGAPVAHEDDAERAVRASLRIEIAVRAAVTTGEAVVALGASPFLEGSRHASAFDSAARAGAEAAVAESRGATGVAASLYREAAGRWEDYGSVVERAYALFGLGRCGDDEAAREADEIFAALGARPVVAQAA